MGIRDQHEAEETARSYVWARQDAEGVTDSERADDFARKYAAMWQAFRDEKLFHMPNLRGGYENWQRDGTLWREQECASCGRLLTDALRGEPDPTLPASDPAARRCRRCTNTSHSAGHGDIPAGAVAGQPEGGTS